MKFWFYVKQQNIIWSLVWSLSKFYYVTCNIYIHQGYFVFSFRTRKRSNPLSFLSCFKTSTLNKLYIDCVYTVMKCMQIKKKIYIQNRQKHCDILFELLTEQCPCLIIVYCSFALHNMFGTRRLYTCTSTDV